MPVIVTATLVIALLLALMLTVSVRAHRRKSVTGDSTLIGHAAVVLSWSGQAGARAHGRRDLGCPRHRPTLPTKTWSSPPATALVLTVAHARDASKENVS